MTVEDLSRKEEIITNEIIKRGIEGDINQDKILWDGVVSPEKYLDKNNRYKIMWMLKEPHCDGGFKLGTDLLKPKERIRVMQEYIPALRGMTYVTYGLLNDKYFEKMNVPETDPEMSEVLTRIAWVNISKVKGKSISAKEHIAENYNYWKEILFKQIKTYSPDILIFGGTFEYFENDWKKLFRVSPPQRRKHFSQLIDDMIIISTYHPMYPYYKNAKISIKDYVNNIIGEIYATRVK